MTTLRRLVFACLAVGCSSALAQEAQPPLYSFADLYRLTVSASPQALALVPAAAAPQPRATLATQDGFSAIEPRFTVSQVPASRGWMLLLAGLLAASWVAHRRLTSAY
jgi:hypothetical protein